MLVEAVFNSNSKKVLLLFLRLIFSYFGNMIFWVDGKNCIVENKNVFYFPNYDMYLDNYNQPDSSNKYVNKILYFKDLFSLQKLETIHDNHSSF